MRKYFDTSVIAAYYCREESSSRAEKKLRGSSQVLISPLVEAELSSALGRKVREREISRNDAWKVMLQFRKHLEEDYYSVLTVEHRHYSIASECILRFDNNLRTLDALHAAVVIDNDLAMVTADSDLARACRALGIKTEQI